MGRLSGTGWFALPNRIFEVAQTPYELAVLAYLQRCAGPDGASWPSYETIARACKMSRREAIRIVRELEWRGVIDRQPSRGRRSNVYAVDLFSLSSNGAPRAPLNGAPRAPEQYPSLEQDPVVAVGSISSPSLGSEGGIGKGGNGVAAAARVVITASGFEVPPAVLTQWRSAYPAVDIGLELERAFAWTQANPKHRKSNWHRFLVNWLARTQDRTRPGRAAASSDGMTMQQRAAHYLESLRKAGYA